jgi:hypothetical protein
LKLECASCIFERLRSEGMWDRFGTTDDQEIEAMCDKHLIEHQRLYLEYGGFHSEVNLVHAQKLAKEIERRRLNA